MRAGWIKGEPDRAEEKFKKKREKFWWRYGERSGAQEKRTGQSRVKERRYRKGS